MGDRVYSELTCNRAHLETFLEIGYVVMSDSDPNDQAVSVEEDEANYGNYDELNSLAGKGIPFHGSHGVGSCYSAAAFVSDGRDLIWVQCDTDGQLVVRFNTKTQDAHQDDIEECRRYYGLIEAAAEYCRVDPDASAAIGNPIPTRKDDPKKLKQPRRRSVRRR